MTLTIATMIFYGGIKSLIKNIHNSLIESAVERLLPAAVGMKIVGSQQTVQLLAPFLSLFLVFRAQALTNFSANFAALCFQWMAKRNTETLSALVPINSSCIGVAHNGVPDYPKLETRQQLVWDTLEYLPS